MREIIYYVASTVDGFIAQEDGSYTGFRWDDDFGATLRARFPETFPAHAGGPTAFDAGQMFDAVLMGRRTYDVGLREGITNPYPTLASVVFSRTLTDSADPNVTITDEDPVAVARALKQQPGRAIWLCGGSKLASTLFEAGLVGRLIVKLNPVVFGAGIPLLRCAMAPRALTLHDSDVHPSGHALLYYLVGARGGDDRSA